jgi:hypothetical protein
LRNS